MQLPAWNVLKDLVIFPRLQEKNAELENIQWITLRLIVPPKSCCKEYLYMNNEEPVSALK